MTWWLWILVGTALVTVAWFGGLMYADVMMRRGQSSFLRESIPERPPIEVIRMMRQGKPTTNYQQKRIEVLECKIARLEHHLDTLKAVIADFEEENDEN